ncbi:MAG: hypothetical protein CMN78_03565 [Spirochaetales bacterium]|nr:hypothetical protein [Spirochaetales bacterium]
MTPIKLDANREIITIAEKDDIERLAVFNGRMHGDDVAGMTRELAIAHPDAPQMRWFAVIQTETREILSTVSLIPWTLDYDGVSIKAAEMGIVGTLEKWRKRGFISRLVNQFGVSLSEGGYVLSHIQGIPYFYRQYGYEYAVPLETHYCIELRFLQNNIKRTGESSLSLRNAVNADIPVLEKYYTEHVAHLAISTIRGEVRWKFIIGESLKTGYAADTYVVEHRNKAVGYVRIARQGFGDGLIVSECSRLPYEHFLSLLLQIAAIAKERGKPYIRLNLEAGHPAVKAVLDQGGKYEGGYKWQIRIPDIRKFLETIGLVLNDRLEGSEFDGFSGMFRIHWYRDEIALEISDGEIVRIGPAKGREGYVINIPPNLLAPLMLGQSTVAECRKFYPDIRGSTRAVRLFNVLFPQLEGFLYWPY